jgi:hypothetical protein
MTRKRNVELERKRMCYCLQSFICHNDECLLKLLFYASAFIRDVLWYGDVCMSVRPSFRSSVRSGFSTYNFIFLPHIKLKFVL